LLFEVAMGTPAIRVENLGKSYRLAHASGERAGYKTLRESLTGGVATLANRVRGKLDRGTTEEFWALRDVSFEVQPGEVVGIIGRNGAGKSTLLKVLSRITKPTTGRVEINGRVGSLLEVGTGFHPELTGRENVYLNGSILGMSRWEIDRKFDEIVAFAEVEKFLDTPVKRYSSGMYVRLAFAVAAHLEPEILIVDEVLAVGDAAFQKKCLNRLDQCSSTGSTVLFVSHQISALQRLCKSALLLDSGRVVASGMKEEVIPLYLSEFLGRGAVDSWVDLKTQLRSQTGEVQFIAVRYSGGDASTAGRPAPDRPMQIEVVVNARSRVHGLRFAASIYDRFGTKLVNMDSLAINAPLSFAEGKNGLQLQLSELHLKPGQYTLGLWLADGARVLDNIPEALQLDVVDIPAVESREIALEGDDGVVTGRFSLSRFVPSFQGQGH
jgi:lipopolysaccharide transport system ATP-binding protein